MNTTASVPSMGALPPHIKPTEPIPPKSTLIKTDKPRPHVCPTCTRSFARLEHLKRHERSHTKEKPFQCPNCERCFARRDLLLRHKQKLHATFPESPKPKRQGKRKSVTKSKDENNKNELNGGSGGTQNVIHGLPDIPSLNEEVSTPSLYSNLLKKQINKSGTRSRTVSFSAATSTSYTTNKDVEVFQKSHFNLPTGPPQVEFSTPQLLPVGLGDDDNMSSPFDDYFLASDPLFINPQLLDHDDHHFPLNFGQQQNQHLADGHHLQPQLSNQQHFPSTVSHHHESPSDPLQLTQQQFQEFHLEQQTPSSHFSPPSTQHQPSLGMPGLSLNPGHNNDINDIHNAFDHDHFSAIMSPSNHNDSNNTNNNNNNNNKFPHHSEHQSFFNQPDFYHHQNSHSSDNQPSLSVLNPGNFDGDSAKNSNAQFADFSNDLFFLGLNGGSKDPVKSEPKMDHDWLFNNTNTGGNNGRKDSNGPMNMLLQAGPNASHSGTAQVITPQLRLHVLTTLSSSAAFKVNKKRPHLPSTLELQRYINAYIENFGKHMPFLHHTLEFTADNIPLALSMAAIGALYTFEQANSLSIYEISRCCVHAYLESRRERKDETSNGMDEDKEKKRKNSSPTPLWLVQALVLGVIYGLFSSEPLANDIAVAQANAVVSLAKSAGLHLPPSDFLTIPDDETASVEDKWNFFVCAQERIRTLHVVHTVSCLLATTYNIPSALKNEDIKCGTPSDESLWTATNPTLWWNVLRQKDLSNSLKSSSEGIPFTKFLGRLLAGETISERVSQFTLLSLMYAIHLEVYERRTIHDQKFFDHTDQDLNNNDGNPAMKKRRCSVVESPTSPLSFPINNVNSPNAALSLADKEFSWLDFQKTPLESILRAWETTWSLSPLASLSPSSQYGPLMSDSIPLSSLAHVRLYLDLRKVKEYFWKRDFNSMGRELDNLKVPLVYSDGKQFNALLEAASYGADIISLWEKHSMKWTLETSVSQTFIHTIVSLFDCGLVVSEFLNRLEKNRIEAEWTNEEKQLVYRLRKIFNRVIDLLGHDDIDDTTNSNNNNINNNTNGNNTNNNSSTPTGETSTPKDVLDISGESKQMSILSLQIVRKILCKSYIWPCKL